MRVQRIKDYLFWKMANSSNKSLYIIPTLDGLKVIAVNVVLLMLGLVYANNYVLLFNFILFCLVLGSMFYTHFNLAGIKLESIIFPKLHVNELGDLTLHFSTLNAQGNYFLRAFVKSSLLDFKNPYESFNLKPSEENLIKLSICGKKRGREIISSLYIETLFPLNLFRCFTFLKIQEEVFIFPERLDLNLHEELKTDEKKRDEGDNFHLRPYVIGDSLKRIDWKKLAQSNQWYTRQFENAIPSPVMIILQSTISEDHLKSACQAIYKLHNLNVKYGLNLNDKIIIQPELSSFHLNRCLKELAVYDD